MVIGYTQSPEYEKGKTMLEPGQQLRFTGGDGKTITVKIQKSIGLLTEEQEACLVLMNGREEGGKKLGLAYPDDDDGDIDLLYIYDVDGWYTCEVV